MSIKVNINPGLYQYTNNQRIAEVNGNTVGQCLNHLVKQFPGIEKGLFDKNGKLLNYVDIYVNGESAYPEELAKPVKDGDELYIVITVAGG
jgi:molybdopterin converting factor small subunit